jgi:beta-mannosidase
MPKSMGCVFWQYNDIWPGMSWSSVDYFGRWKALHYLARKFYSPVLVSGLENRVTGKLDIFVTNDFLDAKHGKLSWKATDLTGRFLAGDSFHVAIPSRKSLNVRTLDFQDLINKSGANGFLTWLDLDIGGKTISQNLVLFALPKEYNLADPALDARVDETADGFEVTIAARNPALWVWTGLQEADAKFSDNFFHLAPDAPQKILVQPKSSLTKNDFMQQLRVRSLFDTYLRA